MTTFSSATSSFSLSRQTLWQWALAALLLVASSVFSWSHAAVLPKPDTGTTVEKNTVINAVVNHIRHVAEEENLYNPATDELGVDVLHISEQPCHFFTPLPENEPVTIETDSTLNKQFRHQAYIRVALNHPSGERHTLGVPVRITLTKKVWVAKNKIKPGTALSSKNLVAQKRMLTHELGRVVFADKPLTNIVARVMVLEDDILKSSQITVPLAVRSQAFVKIQMVATRGVRMLIEGKALEDGHVGDLIRVRNKINPSRLYTARVIGPNRVTVKL